MGRECRDRFSHQRLQRKPLVRRSLHASRHVRHPRALMHVGIANPRWRGKRSRNSRRMRNPQFYVSGKRPMGSYTLLSLLIASSILRHKLQLNAWTAYNKAAPDSPISVHQMKPYTPPSVMPTAVHMPWWLYGFQVICRAICLRKYIPGKGYYSHDR